MFFPGKNSRCDIVAMELCNWGIVMGFAAWFLLLVVWCGLIVTANPGIVGCGLLLDAPLRANPICRWRWDWSCL
jgi:hypothetical protein